MTRISRKWGSCVNKVRGLHGRDKFLLVAGSSGMVTRVLATGFGVITTGLLTRLLGREQFGVWATLSILPQWIALADLGAGQALTNRLGQLFGLNDHLTSRLLIWSAFWTQVIISAVFSILIYFLIPFVNFSTIFTSEVDFNSSAVEPTVIWLALGTILILPFRNYSGILMSRQMPLDCAILGILSSAIMLSITVLAFYSSLGMQGYAKLFIISSFASCLFGQIWLFRYKVPELWKPFKIDWMQGMGLTKVGLVYFSAGITWTLNSTIDSFLLAKMIGPGAVTDYNLTLKLFTLAILITSVAGSGLASGYAEALGRCDFKWIKKRYYLTLRGSAIIGLLAAILIGFIAPEIIELWSGGTSKPSRSMVISFTCWFAIFPMNQMIAFILTGLDRAREMLFVGIFTTILNIPLTYLSIRNFGEAGAAMGTGISIFLVGVIYAHFKVKSVISEIS